MYLNVMVVVGIKELLSTNVIFLHSIPFWTEKYHHYNVLNELNSVSSAFHNNFWFYLVISCHKHLSVDRYLY